MKHLKQLSLCLLLAAALATSALAAPVPDTLVSENLNGQQRIVKTYALAPEIDPEELKEPDFEYEGYLYTWAYTLKQENPYLNTKSATETVTVETAKNDLALILAELAPTRPYDDGEYTGELALDHTSLTTEAAGYTTKYSTTTETKVIGGLDRNDMSYVPATTVKNGKTLSLADVEWQVTGTALVGEALVPSQYQAVATYSASSSYQAATGYVTTAEYHGDVVSTGIESITYTVVYTGSAIEPEEPAGRDGILSGQTAAIAIAVLPVLLLAALGGFLFLRRKNVYVYRPGEKPRDYEVIGKFRTSPESATIDLGQLRSHPTGTVAIELKGVLAKKLVGKEFTVLCENGAYTYTVPDSRPGSWHEFDVDILQEVAQ